MQEIWEQPFAAAWSAPSSLERMLKGLPGARPKGGSAYMNNKNMQ